MCLPDPATGDPFAAFAEIPNLESSLTSMTVQSKPVQQLTPFGHALAGSSYIFLCRHRAESPTGALGGVFSNA